LPLAEERVDKRSNVGVSQSPTGKPLITMAFPSVDGPAGIRCNLNGERAPGTHPVYASLDHPLSSPAAERGLSLPVYFPPMCGGPVSRAASGESR